MERYIDINDYNYELPDERIAKFPLAERTQSKLLVYDNGVITESRFANVAEFLPAGATLVFNNTRVVRARVVMHKASGARIEVFCLEPHNPSDYERAFQQRGESEWSCIVGNLKKWKSGEVGIDFEIGGQQHTLRAEIVERGTREHIVRFRWSADVTFGELLEALGRIPIPPYLNRESEDIDNSRYQTVYARYEGSVAAPTAGLHFTEELIANMQQAGYTFEGVTLHVGAGTFLPVKDDNAADHAMHTEHFSVSLTTIDN
ncbi:MAG: S-adenosylmethionine:tRNA ribosyltransferase-isomerase, partial [Alistipes sp.]|nr:S-adenosylmethionine:tRNA ribosyltransferase-isomerase [Alistipes sp.]